MELRRNLAFLSLLAFSAENSNAFTPSRLCTSSRIPHIATNAPRRRTSAVGSLNAAMVEHIQVDANGYSTPTDSSPPTPAEVVLAPPPPQAASPSYSLLETPPDAFQLLANKGKVNGEASKVKTLVSAMLGGFYVGIGGMLSLAISGNLPGLTAANPGLAKLFFAALFPVNLLLCLQAGGQLFTGNAAYMTAAVCEGKCSTRKLWKSWGISYIGNLVAGSTFAVLCKYSGVLSGGAGQLAASTLAAKTSMALGPLMVKAFLCNWLVCLAVYLSFQAKDMAGKYVSIFLPISTFVAIGFEHSVANMFLLPAGLLCSSGISVWDAIFRNLIPVTIGNAISGSLMVGALFSFMFGKLGEGK